MKKQFFFCRFVSLDDATVLDCGKKGNNGKVHNEYDSPCKNIC